MPVYSTLAISGFSTVDVISYFKNWNGDDLSTQWKLTPSLIPCSVRTSIRDGI